MKKEKLIEELQKLPEGIEVCIFDWRKELHNDPGDGSGCSAGIYHEFDVSMAGEDFKAEDSEDFAMLTFENDDYDNDGRIMIEPDDVQPSIPPERVKVTDKEIKDKMEDLLQNDFFIQGDTVREIMIKFTQWMRSKLTGK